MVTRNVSVLEGAERQLVSARKAHAAILAANRRQGVWNEHVFHVEDVAQKLVEKLEKEVARQERHSGNKASAQTGHSKLV